MMKGVENSLRSFIRKNIWTYVAKEIQQQAVQCVERTSFNCLHKMTGPSDVDTLQGHIIH